jgi:hypothetical protein
MGIFSSTVPICQFRVAGELPAGDLYPFIAGRLAAHAFHPIDQGAAEQSVGWVHLDDHRQMSFDAPSAFWRDHYVAFTLRRDQRKLTAALVKAYLQVAEHEYLAAHPGLNRVPKQKREELREAVRASLLARTLPVPAAWDAVWDTRSGIVTFTSLSAPVIELFETQFKKTFEGVRLVAIHPYARAGEIVPEALQPLLAKANQATSEAAIDLIRSNQWLGWDFLLWLLHRSMTESSEYRVCRPGTAQEGDRFVAYLNDRLVLQSVGEHGTQKITMAGPQDHFQEACTALKSGKRITEATLYLEQEENIWKLTLKGELFHFASFKAPRVAIEKGEHVDEVSEREAAFYERLYVLEEGLQLFDSLFAAFLAARLDSGWGGELGRIEGWLAGE